MKEPLPPGREAFGDSGIYPLSALLAPSVALRPRPGYNKMMRSFSLGVSITSSLGDDGVDPGSLSTLASRIVALGADALFVSSSKSHVIEPVTALAAIASSNDLVLGAIVSLGSGRNPSIVAKSATSLALLAPGRCALLFEGGGADDDPRLAEAVQVAVALMQDGPVSAGGAEFFVRDAYNEPRPADVDALAVGAVVSRLTPRLASACDLVLAWESDLGSDRGPKVVPLLSETDALRSRIESLVVQVDGGSADHVADVVAQLASKQR
jgi:alkanesulfonate monooxygenase SsuD/methylene tetrahydromethanopterin reductase-like flavin-dependent oxidoreductase (luciferase family)